MRNSEHARIQQHVWNNYLCNVDCTILERLSDHELVTALVFVAVQQYTVGFLSIPTSTSCLLVIALDRFGQREVNDESHIGLVNPALAGQSIKQQYLIDSHPKCDGSNHDLHLTLPPFVLYKRALRHRYLSMVEHRMDAVLLQHVGNILTFLLAEAVNDTGVLQMLMANVVGNEFNVILEGGLFLPDIVQQVRPVEALLETDRLGDVQVHEDIAHDLVGCSGCETHDWNVGEIGLEIAERHIIGAG